MLFYQNKKKYIYFFLILIYIIQKNNGVKISKEVILDNLSIIVSKANEKGIITYVNDYFCEVSGYSEKELVGQPHNIVRHADMPKCVFKFMWDTIKNGKNIKVVVKNKCKNGDYYWVITDFTIEKENGIKTYHSKQTKIDAPVKNYFEKLYAKLKRIEETQTVEEALAYFLKTIEKEGFKSYEDLIENRVNRKFLGLFRY